MKAKRIDVAWPCSCCGKRLGTADKVAFWVDKKNIKGLAHKSCGNGNPPREVKKVNPSK